MTAPYASTNVTPRSVAIAISAARDGLRPRCHRPRDQKYGASQSTVLRINWSAPNRVFAQSIGLTAWRCTHTPQEALPTVSGRPSCTFPLFVRRQGVPSHAHVTRSASACQTKIQDARNLVQNGGFPPLFGGGGAEWLRRASCPMGGRFSVARAFRISPRGASREGCACPEMRGARCNTAMWIARPVWEVVPAMRGGVRVHGVQTGSKEGQKRFGTRSVWTPLGPHADPIWTRFRTGSLAFLHTAAQVPAGPRVGRRRACRIHFFHRSRSSAHGSDTDVREGVIPDGESSGSCPISTGYALAARGSGFSQA